MNNDSLKFRVFKAIMALPVPVCIFIPSILLYVTNWQPGNFQLWRFLLGIDFIGCINGQIIPKAWQWHSCAMGFHHETDSYRPLCLCAQPNDYRGCPYTRQRGIDAFLIGYWHLGGRIPYHKHVLLPVVWRTRPSKAFWQGIWWVLQKCASIHSPTHTLEAQI